MVSYINGEKLLTEKDVPTSFWNLIDNSATFTKYANLNQSTDEKIITPNGNKAMTKSTAWNFPSTEMNIVKGQTYTISFMARFASNSNLAVMKMYPAQNGEYEVIKDTAFSVHDTIPNVWQKGYVVFRALKDTTITVGMSTSQDVKTDFGDYMVNKGTYPLDWNYSLNDLKSKLGG